MNTRPQPGDKPILCLDFDGVIHSYSSGWQGATNIPDPPVPGVFKWIESALPYFQIHVYSTRSSNEGGCEAMYDYIVKYAEEALADMLYFPIDKPYAAIMIDDRALTFKGDWSDPQFDPRALLNFKPWNK